MRLNVDLNDDQRETIRGFCFRNDVTQSQLIRAMLDELQDDSDLGKRIMERIKAS